jgi:hypothetical protein
MELFRVGLRLVDFAIEAEEIKVSGGEKNGNVGLECVTCTRSLLALDKVKRAANAAVRRRRLRQQKRDRYRETTPDPI